MKFIFLLTNEITPKEEKLLLLLESDPLFEKAIKTIRKKLNLPEEGIEIEITKEGKIRLTGLTESHKKAIKELNLNIYYYIQIIENTYRLPYSWWNTLYLIILFNLVIPPMRDKKGYKAVEIKYIGGLDTLVRRLQRNYDYPTDIEPHIEIFVREGLSFEALMRELKKEKATLDRYLSYLHKIPEIKMTNLQIKKEILSLSKELTDKEIGDELEKRHKKISFLTDYDTIRKYRERFIKKIESLSKNKSLLFLDEYLEQDKDS